MFDLDRLNSFCTYITIFLTSFVPFVFGDNYRATIIYMTFPWCTVSTYSFAPCMYCIVLPLHYPTPSFVCLCYTRSIVIDSDTRRNKVDEIFMLTQTRAQGLHAASLTCLSQRFVSMIWLTSSYTEKDTDRSKDRNDQKERQPSSII